MKNRSITGCLHAKEISKIGVQKVLSTSEDNRECIYCHEPGNLITKCSTLERKGQDRPARHEKSGAGLISQRQVPMITLRGSGASLYFVVGVTA